MCVYRERKERERRWSSLFLSRPRVFTQLFLPFVKLTLTRCLNSVKSFSLLIFFFLLVDGDCLPFKQVNLFSFCLFNQIKTSFFSPTKYIKFSNYNDLFGSIEILLSLSELFLLNQSDKKSFNAQLYKHHELHIFFIRLYWQKIRSICSRSP